MNRSSKPQGPPKKPQCSPSASSRVSMSTISKRTRSPQLSEAVRPRKNALTRDPRAQSTLTQIDFVTQATQLDDEQQLCYIDEPGSSRSPHDTNEPVHIGDDPKAGDADYQLSRRTRSALARIETNKDHHTKQRRKGSGVSFHTPGRLQAVRQNQTPQSSINSRGKRKSNEKPPVKRDKTLTQMDFVRRYITIDDDDVNLGYIQADPQKIPQQQAKTESEATGDGHSSSSKRKRRALETEVDLSTGEPISYSEDTQTTSPSAAPVTPSKPRRLEIPSSQSPESPGLAIITSSQFRSATRSPSKRNTSSLVHQSDNHVNEDSPKSQRVIRYSQNHTNSSPSRTPTMGFPNVLGSPKQDLYLLAQNPGSDATFASSTPKGVRGDNAEMNSHNNQKERTVVYETDAETELSDSGDDLDKFPVTPFRPSPPNGASQTPPHNPDSPADGSQEVPLPRIQPFADLDPESLCEAPMSDASVFYQRMQPATQYPHEPIPTLNTQVLSELFPNEGSTQHYGIGLGPPGKYLGPFSQSQTQSQDPNRTEVVPESSPVRELQNSLEVEAMPESVQVESSQPVNWTNNGLKGAISRSQLLTSSVMESAPMPNFCMGSQDSVGEPYELNDR